MKAILIKNPGDASQLYAGEAPESTVGEGELLVKVAAAAVNRADILQRQGKYPPPSGASDILGLDMAGEVVKTGPGCSKIMVGDRVMALLPGGGYAEYAVISEDMAMPMPESISFAEAAAIPEVFLTAYQALVKIGELRAGETVLLHAGASGVGTAGIQIAKVLGATVVVTAGSKEKLNACKKLGALEAVNYKEGPFSSRVLQVTSNKGVNLIVDFVGAPYWEQNVNVLGVDGRIVILATMGGSQIREFDLRALMGKRIQLTGSTLRNRSGQYKAALTADFAAFALPLFRDGRLKAVVDKVFPWKEASQAHKYVEENRNIGKVVLDFMD